MKKTDLLGAPERRALSLPFEIRSKRSDTLELEGYASVFGNFYEVGGGPPFGFNERVDRRAFDVTLSRSPDVHLLINHEGLPLARTRSGTLDLSTDGEGLKVNARLDMRDPDVQRLAPKMERGDMDQMSFAFRTIRHEWNEEETERTLLEVSLDRGDVSVVNFGANPATTTSIKRSLELLADLDVDAALAEVRGDGDALIAALRKLSEIRSRIKPSSTLSVLEAERLIESV